MSDPAAPGRVSAYPPAGLDLRFYAFAIDRLIAWPLMGLGGYLGYRLFFADGDVWPGIGLVLGVVLLIGLAFSVALGLAGTSPGKAAMGLRVVRAEGGTPIGIGRALLRTLVLGVAALPTFGFGVATLAQTAVMDRGRQRRGWHDHLSHSVVVDVRPVEERVAAVADDAPRQVVNLTALRLAPAPPAVPTPIPPRRQQTQPVTGVGTRVDRPPPGAPPVAMRPPTLPPGAPPGRTPFPPGPPPGAPPVPPPSSAEADRTVVRGAARSAASSPRWRVTFDTGDTFLVEGLGLVGRRPEGRPGEPVRHLVPLPSDDMSVSKTHAQFQVAADGVLVVMDRGSTNGSMLVRSGVARDLSPGKPTTLLSGDLVRFGDRSMTVVRES